jgi:hypothetical protein
MYFHVFVENMVQNAPEFLASFWNEREDPLCQDPKTGKEKQGECE